MDLDVTELKRLHAHWFSEDGTAGSRGEAFDRLVDALPALIAAAEERGRLREYMTLKPIEPEKCSCTHGPGAGINYPASDDMREDCPIHGNPQIFAALAERLRLDVEQRDKAIAAVRELHYARIRTDRPPVPTCSSCGDQGGYGRLTPWPCPTIAALDAHLGADQ